MNARGSGVEWRDLPKCVEGFSKPREGKSKSLGRKFKARGSEIQVTFFRESGLFKGLRVNPDREPLFSPTRPSAAGASARGRAKMRRRDASPQGWSRACFARAVPQSMPASLSGRPSRPFGEPRATIAQILKIGNKNPPRNAPVGDNPRIIKTKYPLIYRIHAFDRRTLPLSPLRVWTGERRNSQTPRNSGSLVPRAAADLAYTVARLGDAQTFRVYGRLSRNRKPPRPFD
jgi:hypothetical protein